VFFWNPMYFVFALPAMLLAMWAQMRVRSAYGKYLRVQNQRGMSGLQAAEHLLRAQGLAGVSVEGARGQLTDHYDPRKKTLSAVFALLTLPVERNASQRALQMLRTNGLIVQAQEEAGARQVLDAASLTYVAALVQVLSTLLYYVFLLTGFSRRRD
jgi:Zn-dependent membrane protease YugP